MMKYLYFSLLLACGGDGPSPVDQCADFKNAYCARLVICGSALDMKACSDAVAATIDCSTIVAVSASFDQCMAELPTFSCAVFDGGKQPPASCKNTLLRARP